MQLKGPHHSIFYLPLISIRANGTPFNNTAIYINSLEYSIIIVRFLACLNDTHRTFPPESDLNPLLTAPEPVFRWGCLVYPLGALRRRSWRSACGLLELNGALRHTEPDHRHQHQQHRHLQQDSNHRALPSAEDETYHVRVRYTAAAAQTFCSVHQL